MVTRQLARPGHRERPSPRVVIKSKLLQLLAVLAYIIAYLIVFAPRAENLNILVSILGISAAALWFGPVSLIDRNNGRKVYDPKTLFNTAIFYYVIKAVPFAWNSTPASLSVMTTEDIVQVFPKVALHMALGLLCWNWAYQRAIDTPLPALLTGSEETKRSPNNEQKYSYAGVVLLAFVGALSFYMLFDSTGGDIMLFIRRPWLFAYLGTSDFEVRSSFGFLWAYGTYLMPLAALIWLAINGSHGRNPGLSWWVYFPVSMVALALFSPRAIVVGFIVSALVVYHLAVSRLRFYVFLLLGFFSLVFSYLINLWRIVTRTVSLQGIEEGVGIIAAQVDVGIDQVVGFLAGTDLSDLRTFALIAHSYGSELPLRYGATLLRIFYQVIPRAIWPEKPLGLGYEIGLLLGATYSGVPPGFFGEMYMNFHVVGAILGGLILGYVLAFLYRRWIVKGDGVTGIVLYAILVPTILLLPSSTIANRVLSAAILLVATFLAFRGSSSGQRGVAR